MYIYIIYIYILNSTPTLTGAQAMLCNCGSLSLFCNSFIPPGECQSLYIYIHIDMMMGGKTKNKYTSVN